MVGVVTVSVSGVVMFQVRWLVRVVGFQGVVALVGFVVLTHFLSVFCASGPVL